MPTDSKSVIRCAIYTRKSSEEGLDQSFNSLEAQREACEAYIASQKHERWRCCGVNPPVPRGPPLEALYIWHAVPAFAL